MMVEKNKRDINEKAIGGWLLIFILILTVITPVGSILSLILEYKIAAFQIHLLLEGSYQAGAILNGLLKIAVAVFSVYTGISLLKRKRNAIRIVKTYLVIFFCYSIVSALLSFIIDLPVDAIVYIKGEAWKRIVYALIFVTVWYLYLTRSRRVKEIWA